MMLSQKVKKEQMCRRLELKGAEETFSRLIVDGTSCTPFESAIIAEKAKEVFRIEESGENRMPQNGQMILYMVSADGGGGNGTGRFANAEGFGAHS